MELRLDALCAKQFDLEGYCFLADGLVDVIDTSDMSLSQSIAALTILPEEHPVDAVCIMRMGQRAYLKFYEDLTSLDALLAARVALRRMSCDTVTCHILSSTSGPPFEAAVPRKIAIKILKDFLVDKGASSHRVFETELDLSSLPQFGELALIVNLWAQGGGCFNETLIDPVLNYIGFERRLRCLRDDESGDFIMADAGLDMHRRDQGMGWFANSAGKPVRSLPDSEYARFTSGTYRATSDRGVPTLHRVSADIHWADHDQFAWRDYCRLTIPYEAQDGRQMVFAAMSEIDF